MTETKQNQSKQAVHPVVAGAVGAAVGAGVAVVASAALKDEKTRKKVKEVLNNVKDQALAYVDTLQKQPGVKKLHEVVDTQAQQLMAVGEKHGVSAKKHTKQPIKK